MTPDEIRSEREKLHLTRAHLALRAGVKTGRLAAIETGHGQPMSEDEHKCLTEALIGKVAGKVPVSQGVVRTVDEREWCGLAPGDVVAVRGIKGARFRFVRYVEQQNGHTYVELVGGKGRGSKAVHNLRCIAPERVLDIRGRAVQQLWRAANPDEIKPVEDVGALEDASDEEEEDE